MAQRLNHYDAAFEEYLRRLRTPYVAVDEQRRALLENASLKSMDFIVYSANNANLLIDVKGRRFPVLPGESGNRWENWATADDIASLTQWQAVFGESFRSLLVFAYDTRDNDPPVALEDPFVFRRHRYSFYGIWVDDYRQLMSCRSPSWGTVCLPNRVFRRLRMPMRVLL